MRVVFKGAKEGFRETSAIRRAYMNRVLIMVFALLAFVSVNTC